MTYCGPPKDAGLQPMPTFCVRPKTLPLGCSRSMSGVRGSRPAGPSPASRPAATALAGYVAGHTASPPLQSCSVGLAEAPLVVALDVQRFENLGRDPRQFRAGVHQHGLEGSSLARAGRVLDLHVYAEGSHVVGHNNS